MKNSKTAFTLFLLMFTSSLFAQQLSTGTMKINWTADIVLGKDYTITKTYTVGDTNFVICYSEGSGRTTIWNLDKEGNPVYDTPTHKGWTSLVFFKLENKTYMFSYKKAIGEVIFFEMTHNGIGKRVGEYKWSEGWNGFDVLYTNNEPTLIMTRASDGRAKLFKPHF